MSRYFKDLMEKFIAENREFRKGMDKMLESKIDDGWTVLDTKNVPRDYFDNGRYEVERASIYGSLEWLPVKTQPCDRWKHIQIANEGQIKYRYKLKPLAPITLSRTDLKIIDHWISVDKSFMDYESNNGVLTKFNGREVIIL